MRYLASSFPLSPRNDWEDANCRTQSNLKYKSNKHQQKNTKTANGTDENSLKNKKQEKIYKNYLILPRQQKAK
jgi:hypothetical protein